MTLILEGTRRLAFKDRHTLLIAGYQRQSGRKFPSLSVVNVDGERLWLEKQYLAQTKEDEFVDIAIDQNTVVLVSEKGKVFKLENQNLTLESHSPRCFKVTNTALGPAFYMENHRFKVKNAVIRHESTKGPPDGLCGCGEYLFATFTNGVSAINLSTMERRYFYTDYGVNHDVVSSENQSWVAFMTERRVYIFHYQGLDLGLVPFLEIECPNLHHLAISPNGHKLAVLKRVLGTSVKPKTEETIEIWDLHHAINMRMLKPNLDPKATPKITKIIPVTLMQHGVYRMALGQSHLAYADLEKVVLVKL